MVSRSLYRGPAHVCVDQNVELRDRVGDYVGMPIRERFPELGGTGLFEAMDAVYITGEPIGMEWRSIVDDAVGTMLILPDYDEDGALSGVGLHWHPCGRPVATRAPRRVPSGTALGRLVPAASPLLLVALVDAILR